MITGCCVELDEGDEAPAGEGLAVWDGVVGVEGCCCCDDGCCCCWEEGVVPPPFVGFTSALSFTWRTQWTHLQAPVEVCRRSKRMQDRSCSLVVTEYRKKFLCYLLNTIAMLQHFLQKIRAHAKSDLRIIFLGHLSFFYERASARSVYTYWAYVWSELLSNCRDESVDTRKTRPGTKVSTRGRILHCNTQ